MFYAKHVKPYISILFITSILLVFLSPISFAEKWTWLCSDDQKTIFVDESSYSEQRLKANHQIFGGQIWAKVTYSASGGQHIASNLNVSSEEPDKLYSIVLLSAVYTNNTMNVSQGVLYNPDGSVLANFHHFSTDITENGYYEPVFFHLLYRATNKTKEMFLGKDSYLNIDYKHYDKNGKRFIEAIPVASIRKDGPNIYFKNISAGYNPTETYLDEMYFRSVVINTFSKSIATHTVSKIVNDDYVYYEKRVDQSMHQIIPESNAEYILKILVKYCDEHAAWVNRGSGF